MRANAHTRRHSWISSVISPSRFLALRGVGLDGSVHDTVINTHTHTHMLWLCLSKFLSLLACMVRISWLAGEALIVFICTYAVRVCV